MYAGSSPELGTKIHIDHIRAAWAWDVTSRAGTLPNAGGEIEAHEFDYSKTQHLTVFNVTPEQIVIRQAKTEWLWWAPKDPDAKGGDTLERGYSSPAATPDWVAGMKLESGSSR